jgi:predicted site-specific integrase-resolvase
MDNSRYLCPKNACKILGVHYKTLYSWEEKNMIDTVRTPGGKRLYNVDKYIKNNSNIKNNERKNICYCRVSSYGQKDDLARQIEFMKNKYPNYVIIKDIGSGLNFKRKGLKRIIDMAIKGEINNIIVAYKDRLCRFGFELIEHIIEEYSNGKIIALNERNLSPNEELTRDLVSIINIFSSRINGLRKYKKAISELK